MRKCTKCKESKPANLDFFSKSNKLDGLSSWCRDCTRVANRVSNNKHSRKYHLKKYGLTIEDVERLRKFQDNKCASCKKRTINLVVDHNHITGQFRALVCVSCNIVMGQVHEDEKQLIGIIKYLRKFNE